MHHGIGQTTGRVSKTLTLLAAALSLFPASDRPAAAAERTPLQPMVSISWKRGPSLPQGFQDSDGGILADTLVSVGGFCSGQKGVPGKLDRYPRGFLKKVWGLDLKGAAWRWQELPDFPGTARQGLDAVVVKDRLYCWGGFSYSAPHCYRDGYRLARQDGRWKWDRLPPLPWPVTAHGSCVIGSMVYVLGGADFDGQKFFTGADRAGKVKRLGARLLVIDTDNLAAGWKELAACPGTPRFDHAVATVGGKVYILGGATDLDNAARQTCTVVDNWRYLPGTKRWERLPDLPVASGNFPSGPIVFDGRYLLLIGGYQYGMVLDPDGKIRAPYGKPTRHYPDNSMCSDVFVYDTRTDTFGTATPLPLNNSLPMAVVQGNRLHLIGGEIGKAVLDGEHFGHHPDLYLVGTIQPVRK